MLKVMNVGFIVEGDRMLLGLKKRGFGKGKWNGFGGKVKEGETPEQALVREFEEECEILVKKCEEVGQILFNYQDSGELLQVHFYRVTEYVGQPVETEEMKPKWFHIKDFPYKDAWEDDKHWMPFFLAGKKFKGEILFKDQKNIIKVKLLEVSGF